jgi:hypothetical protein
MVKGNVSNMPPGTGTRCIVDRTLRFRQLPHKCRQGMFDSYDDLTAWAEVGAVVQRFSLASGRGWVSGCQLSLISRLHFVILIA